MDDKLSYNATYYRNHMGEVDYESNQMVEIFEKIAKKIKEDFNPKTVLDVGCAEGYLVKALRDLGVEAYGIDVSQYAISQASEDIKDYCKACSVFDELPDSFPAKYDLVVTIEVIEHIQEELAFEFIEKICTYGNVVLFSSTPDDYDEITHRNVQKQEYWTKLFAKKDFFRNVEYDLTYISKQSIMFVKKDAKVPFLIEDYERFLRVELEKYRKVYAENVERIHYLDETLSTKEEQIRNLLAASDCKDKLIDDLKSQNNTLSTDNRVLSESKKMLDEIFQNIIVKFGWLENMNVSNQSVSELEEKIKILEKNNRELEEINRYLKDVEDKADETSELLRDRDNRISDFINTSNYLNSLLSAKEQELATANALAQQYNAVIHSTCWKITAPLRKIVNLLRGNRKAQPQIAVQQQQAAVNSASSNAVVEQPKAASRKSTIQSILDQQFRNTQPIQCIRSDESITRLNVVTDSIEKNSLLGGVATALIVATEFARKMNLPIRIITRDTSVNAANYNNIIKISGLEPYDNVSFYSDCERDADGNINFKLDVTKTDIFFATSWWSAKAIKSVTIRKRFFYIIQEVETFFYNHGDHHYLCSEIMQDKNIDFIINSHYLYDYFKETAPNIIENGVYFEPAFSRLMYHPKPLAKKRKYKLFFYARPNNPRNMFYYGIKILNEAIIRGVLDTNEWDIYCAGQNIPKLIFDNGYEAIDLGLMDWEKYGEFLSDVDLSLSLMYTPHPSYPPFDVACSGGVVLTNKCLNKTEFPYSKNVVVADLQEDKFLDGMEQAINLAKNFEEREINYKEQKINDSWVDTIKPVIQFMEDKY